MEHQPLALFQSIMIKIGNRELSGNSLHGQVCQQEMLCSGHCLDVLYLYAPLLKRFLLSGDGSRASAQAVIPAGMHRKNVFNEILSGCQQVVSTHPVLVAV
jgi:hypothetical protein